MHQASHSTGKRRRSRVRIALPYGQKTYEVDLWLEAELRGIAWLHS